MALTNNQSTEGLAPELPVCPNCGLRTGHKASFTYWLFQENRCRCDAVQGAKILEEKLPGSVGTLEHPNEQVLNDRYKLVDLLGEGGMGYVYKATDLVNGEEVALKLMRPEFSKNDWAVKRVMQEVSVASRLNHLNLGHVRGYGQEKGGSPYLVMEFVPGSNLEDVIASESALKPARALDIFIQTCSGLECAHENGIIHRDLKPGNVIIQKESNGRERAKIVDFGFARLLSEADGAGNTTRLTQTGEVFGSPAFMSPEQCLGEELDQRSDIYSFGCLMYQVLTGQPPLVGENVLSTVARHIRESAPSMREFDSRIPENIDAVVLNCLEREPLRRYQTARDLHKDLEKARKGEFVKGPSRRINENRGQAASAASTLRQTSNAKDHTTSIVLRSVVAGAGIAAIVFGALWFATQNQQQNSSKPNARQAQEAPPAPHPDEKPGPKAVPSKAVPVDKPNTPVKVQPKVIHPISHQHHTETSMPVTPAKNANGVHSHPSVDWGSIGKLRQNK